jgi:hypothetical protein
MLTPLLTISKAMRCTRCGVRRGCCWPEPQDAVGLLPLLVLAARHLAILLSESMNLRARVALLVGHGHPADSGMANPVDFQRPPKVYDRTALPSEYWQKRAEEAKAEADKMHDAECKQIMLDIAKAYERIADVARQGRQDPKLTKQ